MNYFSKTFWPAFIPFVFVGVSVALIGVSVALIVAFAPDTGQTDCIVKAQITYAKQLEGETAEAYKLKVECNGIEQTVETDKLFPIGSTITKKWVMQ